MTKKEFSKRCLDELQAKHPELNTKLRVLRISGIVFIVLSLLMLLTMGALLGPLPLLIYAGILFWAKKDPAYKNYETKLLNYAKSGEYEKYPVDYPQSFLYPGEPYPFQTTYSTTTIFNTGVQNQTPMMMQPQTGFAQTPRPVQPQAGFTQTPPAQPQTGFAQPQPVQPQTGFAQPQPVQPQTGYMQTSRPVQPQTAQVQGTWQAKPVVAQMASTTEQIVCISCKQQLTIPSVRESIMVTCPSCKNSFLYTPGK